MLHAIEKQHHTVQFIFQNRNISSASFSFYYQQKKILYILFMRFSMWKDSLLFLLYPMLVHKSVIIFKGNISMQFSH